MVSGACPNPSQWPYNRSTLQSSLPHRTNMKNHMQLMRQPEGKSEQFDSQMVRRLTLDGDPRWTSFPCQNLRLKCLMKPTLVSMKSKPGLQSKLPYPKTQTDFPSTFILVSVRVIKEMEWIIDNENLFIGEKEKKERMSLSAVKSIFGGRDEKSTHISSSCCLFSSKRGKKYFSFKTASSHTFLS